MGNFHKYMFLVIKGIIISIVFLCIIFMSDTILIIVPCAFGSCCLFFLHQWQKNLENTVKIIRVLGENITFITTKDESYTCKINEIISVELNFTCTGYNFVLKSGKIKRTNDYVVKPKLFIEGKECTPLFKDFFGLK